MSRKVYCIVAVLVLIGIAGLVGAQVSGTKPAGSAVVVEKEKAKTLTVEQRIMNLEKNQQKILAELKEVKENQKEILDWCKKIFTNMARK